MDKIKVSVEVPKGEHPGWREHARLRGFDGNLAAYIRWLVRCDMHKPWPAEGKDVVAPKT